jgi:hypothetical protein
MAELEYAPVAGNLGTSALAGRETEEFLDSQSFSLPCWLTLNFKNLHV